MKKGERSTMADKMIENNKVSVIGEIVSGFTFSHEVFGEGFYVVEVAVSRLSEQADIIPLMISERLINVKEDYQGCTVEAIGQFRSYNRHEGVKNRLYLSVGFILWKNSRIIQKRIRSSLTGTYARIRFTAKLLSEERLQIFFWR